MGSGCSPSTSSTTWHVTRPVTDLDFKVENGSGSTIPFDLLSEVTLIKLFTFLVRQKVMNVDVGGTAVVQNFSDVNGFRSCTVFNLRSSGCWVCVGSIVYTISCPRPDADLCFGVEVKRLWAGTQHQLAFITVVKQVAILLMRNKLVDGEVDRTPVV